MTAAEALAEIRGLAFAGRVHFIQHARVAARKRGFTLQEVVDGLATAHGCRLESAGRWRALCRDWAGDPSDAIVEIEDELIVVTVFAE